MPDVSPRPNDPADDLAPIRPAAGEDVWAGKKIGPYLIEKRISRGGMGEVLLGFDEGLRRHVAVKVMEGRFAEDPEARRRFDREARAAAAIVHPHIAAVYLVGETEEGIPFLAMEYVDGGSLMEAIRKRRVFNYSEIARIMEQVASALEAAAKQNIIHRDIKPANIMLDRGGDAKVVDFGLAKIFFEDSFLTQDGLVLGTPSYMAPEQGQGRVVDHRADIYAFGAMFYHLIVGRAPFTADSPVQIMMKHVTAPLVPMRTINPHVPIEFDEVIGLCMRKDVDERYQDYESLLRDIKRIRLQSLAREGGSLLGAPSPPPPPSGASAPSTSWAAAPAARPLNEPLLEEEESRGLGLIHLITIAAASLLILVAVAVAIFRPAEEEVVAEKPEGQQRAITLWLQQAAQKARQPSESAEPDELSHEATLDILDSLRSGIVNYQVEADAIPESLGDIATPDRVLVNFEQNERGVPLDGWGTPIEYDRNTGRLRSAGKDLVFESGDDITLSVDGELDDGMASKPDPSAG